MAMFAERVAAYFEQAYESEQPPDDLIHVTCTGYVSPSGAQQLVARKGWGAYTRVTHAYHMGCYAALPAVRMAAGFTAIGARRVDIVHTELCSLHLDPADHRVEQLVVQSLFADGLIRYSMLPDSGPGLHLVTSYEVVLPGSDESMAWRVGDHGMQMTLARDVPDRIAKALREFVLELFRRGGMHLGHMKTSLFAVHPGGPKIIDRVRDVLELDDEQVAASRGVLRDFGNMSSATLPHIWMRMLADPDIPRGTLIPSLAFGPGLTVCGALLEKR
jgi:predicted naringenin-chalcone synthase